MGWTPFATTVDDRAVMWTSKPVEFTSKRGARDGLAGRQASLWRGRGRAARAGSQDGGWRTADGDARRQPSERRSSVSMTAEGGGGGVRRLPYAAANDHRCRRRDRSSHSGSATVSPLPPDLPLQPSPSLDPLPPPSPPLYPPLSPPLDSLPPYHWIHQGPHRRHHQACHCRRCPIRLPLLEPAVVVTAGALEGGGSDFP